MIVKETTVERFALDCRGCGHSWSEDYEVHHVQDGHGHDCDYFFRNGMPTLNPMAPGLICPSCRRAAVLARLANRVFAPSTDAPVQTYPTPTRAVDLATGTWLRVVTYRAEDPNEQGTADYMRASARGVVGMLEGMTGFRAGYWGEDATTGTVSAITFWDSWAAINAAEPTLQRLQAERARYGVIVQTVTNIRLLDPADAQVHTGAVLTSAAAT
jgi:heme-degrading monooxygenase HmoA